MRIDGNGPVIMDEGSANGVIVNGVRITAPTAVNQMSRIEVAEFRLSVEPGQAQRPMQVAQPVQPMPMQMPPMSGPDPSLMPVSAQMMPLPMSGQQVPPMMMAPPGMMQPQGMGGAPDLVRLIAEGGPYEGRIFDLPPLQEIAVGRAVDNDLVLDDPSLSRKHAKLRRLGGGRLEVEDANSANGTYVNGRKVGRAQLGPGDTLRFGELMFRVDGGGLVPQVPRQASGLVVEKAPKTAKLAFFGLLGVTVLVWGAFVVKLLGPAAQPPKNLIEAEIAKRIHGADGLVVSAQQALDQHDYAKATNLAQQALDIAPANLEAVRVRSQAQRGEDDENKFSQASRELGRGNAEGIQAALRFFQAMSPDSASRAKLSTQLSGKLKEMGQDQYKRKLYREGATSLCQAFQVAQPAEKPDAGIIKIMRDAEKKAHVTAICALK
jgi:hypothetical protein